MKPSEHTLALYQRARRLEQTCLALIVFGLVGGLGGLLLERPTQMLLFFGTAIICGILHVIVERDASRLLTAYIEEASSEQRQGIAHL